jgi:hypothetical protein
MFRIGYILSWRADCVWFLAFPLFGIAVALACHRWLPAVAQASVGLWITIPHHLATWLRTYGLREDWQRWKGPLIVGPLVVLGTTLLGLRLAPKTLLLLTLLWDHQHSLMQQHGLARIYDFKARTGGPRTGRYDLLLHWFLYCNMLVTAPLFVQLWGPELYQWPLPFAPDTLWWIQCLSWGATTVYLLIYAGHAWRCVRSGYALNPLKYVFVASSYFLWYFTSWHTDSVLVFSIAHRLMHGVQYMVIVNSYLCRKLSHVGDSGDSEPALLPLLTCWRLPSHRAMAFIGMAVVYILLYQLAVLEPFDELGFGVVNFMSVGAPRTGAAHAAGYDLFAATLINALPVTHYYFDSFIWKVSDSKVQQGL